MKELSIEQKAEAYDKALERAKNEYLTHESFNGFCKMLANIFPELKECEDECIRKEIIYHIQNCDDTIDEETEKRMIAWLEKQDKQSSTNKIEQNLWSEEDEKRANRIAAFIWKNRKGDTDEIYQQEQDVNWLKSLKDKIGCEANCITTKEWKPSAEQMGALNYVINLMASSVSPKENDYYYYVFKELREQLKKLKE